MKTETKLLLLALSLLFVFGFCLSCNKEIDQTQGSDLTRESICRLRGYEEALALAKKSISFLSDESEEGTKSSRVRTIEDWFIIEGIQTKSGESDTLVYVFNYGDSAGFAIISANPSVIPILSVSESGHLTPGEPTGVPAFDSYFNSLLAKLDTFARREKKRNGPEVYYFYVYDTLGTQVAPLLGQTMWKQTGVFGAFCPNGICGCFATALGQIMKSFSYPTQFTALCDMSDFYYYGDEVTLHWDYIQSHNTNHASYQNCNPYHDEISAILRDIGACASSTYYTDRTSTSKYQMVSTLQHYGFTCSDLVAANTTLMISSINNGSPIFMFSPGHFYVADGYKNYTITRFKYEQADPDSGYSLTQTVITEDIHAMHINWGWGGICNGYFAFGDYNTANGIIYDTNTNNVSYDFTNNAQMVYNIHPPIIPPFPPFPPLN